MAVGILLVDLYIPEATSLKEKRMSINSLMAKLRERFNISVAEVDKDNLWQRATILIAACNSNYAGLNAVLNNVIQFIERQRGVDIIDFSIKFVS